MRVSRFLLVAVLAKGLLLSSAEAQADPARIALVIGNNGYSKSIGQLEDPHRDAALVADALKSAGFSRTEFVRDTSRADMLRALQAHTRALADAGKGAMGVIYFSGHGLSVGRTNMLLPVDIKTASLASFEDGGVSVSDMLNRLTADAPAAFHYVILDACRATLGDGKLAGGFHAEDRRSGVMMTLATPPGRTTAGATMMPDKMTEGFAQAFAAELRSAPQFDLTLFNNVRGALLYKVGDKGGAPWVADGIAPGQRPVFGNSQANADKFCQSMKTMDSEPAIDAMVMTIKRNEAYTGQREKMLTCASERLAQVAAPGIKTLKGFVPLPSLSAAEPPSRGYVMVAPDSGTFASRTGNTAFTDSLIKAMASGTTELGALERYVSANVVQNTNGKAKPTVGSALFKREPVDLASASHAGRKVALVVGAGEYDRLPGQDYADDQATAVAQGLSRLGFQTTPLLNPNEEDVRRQLEVYRRQLPSDSMIVVYFAGAGAQLNGSNYIAARDASAPDSNGFALNSGWIGVTSILDTLALTNPRVIATFFDTTSAGIASR